MISMIHLESLIVGILAKPFNRIKTELFKVIVL